MTISFDGSHNPIDAVEIYNVKGQKIKTLKNNNTSDTNKIFWDGRNEQGNYVATETYFCRINTPKGGGVSPLFANIYLNLVDRAAKRKDSVFQKYKIVMPIAMIRAKVINFCLI
jgi:flagellar hook assembly protein FlgD